MTKWIVSSVIAGILAGYFFVPDAVVNYCDIVIVLCLCLILFTVGLDIGRKGTLLDDIKKIGWKIILMPLAVIAGSLMFAVAAGLILPMTIRECVAVSAGFGWYSLAPMLLADYSMELSAMSFLSNVMREVFAVLLIPVVAKRVGFLETTALPGAAAMDVCLPVIVESTDDTIAVYAFFTGIVLSIAVPFFIPVIMIGY